MGLEDMYLQSVSSGEEAIPLGDTDEAFVNSNHGTIASTKAGDSPDHLIGLVIAVLVSFTCDCLKDRGLTKLASTPDR